MKPSLQWGAWFFLSRSLFCFPKVRLRAVKLVGKIGGPEAGPALHPRLAESDDRVLREVVRNLGGLQYEPAMEDLADMVTESNADMVRALADAFKGYGKPGLDLIVSRYDSAQGSNRADYKDLLIAVGPEIADSISKLLKGRSFFENRDTFDILKSVKNPRVATLMIPYLADEEIADQVMEAMRHQKIPKQQKILVQRVLDYVEPNICFLMKNEFYL